MQSYQKKSFGVNMNRTILRTRVCMEENQSRTILKKSTLPKNLLVNHVQFWRWLKCVLFNPTRSYDFDSESEG